MGSFTHICLLLAVGMLLGLAAHLHWQGMRQIMPATGAVAILAGYVFTIASNADLPVVVSIVLSVLAGEQQVWRWW